MPVLFGRHPGKTSRSVPTASLGRRTRMRSVGIAFLGHGVPPGTRGTSRYSHAKRYREKPFLSAWNIWPTPCLAHAHRPGSIRGRWLSRPHPGLERGARDRCQRYVIGLMSTKAGSMQRSAPVQYALGRSRRGTRTKSLPRGSRSEALSPPPGRWPPRPDVRSCRPPPPILASPSRPARDRIGARVAHRPAAMPPLA